VSRSPESDPGCTSGTITDPPETILTDGEGLQNLGNGDHQLNWKTSKALGALSKAMTLNVGGGVTKRASFSFTK
jgi:hypothetical protein